MAVLVLVLAATCCLQLGAQQSPEKPTAPSAQNESSEKSGSPGEPTPLRTLSGEVVYRGGNGVTPPRAIKSPDPKYPKSAKGEGIEGTVVLWLIVNSQGSPEQIKVKKLVGHGFDQSAVDAVSRWKFNPATKDGKPVAVAINVEVNFRLY
jgi:TonB family protein